MNNLKKDPVTTAIDNKKLERAVDIKDEAVYVNGKLYNEDYLNIRIINEHGIVSYSLPIKFKGYNLRDIVHVTSHGNFVFTMPYLLGIGSVGVFFILMLGVLKLFGII